MSSRYEDTWPDVIPDFEDEEPEAVSFNTGLLIAAAVIVFVAWIVLAAYVAYGRN